MPPTFSCVAFLVQGTTFSSMDYSRIILIVLSSPPAPSITYSPHSSQDVFLKNEIRKLRHSNSTQNEIPTPNHGLQDFSLSLHLLYFAPSSSVLGVHWKDWYWSWNSKTLATSRKELTHWKRPWCWEGLGAGGEGDDRGWDGWMASLTRWTWVWLDSGSWWWTGRLGVLRFMGFQSRTRLSDWTELSSFHPIMLWTHIVHIQFRSFSLAVSSLGIFLPLPCPPTFTCSETLLKCHFLREVFPDLKYHSKNRRHS